MIHNANEVDSLLTCFIAVLAHGLSNMGTNL